MGTITRQTIQQCAQIVDRSAWCGELCLFKCNQIIGDCVSRSYSPTLNVGKTDHRLREANREKHWLCAERLSFSSRRTLRTHADTGARICHQIFSVAGNSPLHSIRFVEVPIRYPNDTHLGGGPSPQPDVTGSPPTRKAMLKMQATL